MKILRKDNVMEWILTEKFDYKAVQNAINILTKKNIPVRLPVECFTNIFAEFDDDVEIRNFVYLSLSEKGSYICADAFKRKIEIGLEESKIRLLSNQKQFAPQTFSSMNLGEIESLLGEEEKELFDFVLLNSKYERKSQRILIVEELLEQIIVLEEGMENADW